MRAQIKSVIALTLICLTVTAVLATVNRFTSPKIAQNEADNERAALAEVMPNGTFSALDLSALPQDSSVVAGYRDDNGGGYVFRMTVKGFQPGMTVLCGIGADGTVTGVRTLVCNETAGYGLAAKDAAFTDRFTGRGKTQFDDIIISGATLTTNAYHQAIRDAFGAFEIYGAQKAQ